MMTITERNFRQHELRQQMVEANRKAEFCRLEIARLNRVYKEQLEPSLEEQLFNGTASN